MADPQAFAELNGALKKENYAKVIEICNKMRSKLPNDPDLVKIKCIALIRTEKFEKALELATKYDFLTTEKAYCLYRLQDSDQALKLIPSDSKDPVLLHLEAQIHYRKGNFGRSIEIYEYLLSRANKNHDTAELQTNLIAAYVSAGRGTEIAGRDIPVDDSFEVAFNKSFVSIQAGRLDEAKEVLEESEKLCRETCVAEGASPSEVEDETAIIRTQAAYVSQLNGEADSALSSYRDILKLKLRNDYVSAVASNNIVAIRKDKDLFDSLKRLKSIDTDALSEKLTSEQLESILCNRALILCLMNKTEECRQNIEAIKKVFPKSEMLSQIVLLLTLKDQSAAEVLDQLKKDKSVGGRLAVAHVYLTQGEYAKAAGIIRDIDSIAHTPGTVATLVALYEAAKDSIAAQKVLQNALTHYKKHDFTSTDAIKVREGDCAYKIQKKNYQEAAKAYLDLLEGENAGALDPDLRIRSLASLVIALSYTDPKTAAARCAMLPPVTECSMDPQELELSVQRSTRLDSKLADLQDKKNERKRAAKNPERIARKRAKRREAYLESLRAKPDYNASIGLINPDPERWIPRKQRSHGKRGRRGRNRFVGAQGAGMATQKDAIKLDAAARAAAKKAEGAVAEEKKGILQTSDSSAMLRKSKKKKRR